MKARWTRLLIGATVLATLVAAGTVIVLADTGGVIFACVNNVNGSIRIVAQQVSCKPNETAAHWNVIGPQGPAGPQGLAGPAGPPGQSGPQQQLVGEVTVVSPGGGVHQTFEVLNFSFGVTQTTTSGSGGAGRTTLAPASFTKQIDHASPLLLSLLGRGEMSTITVKLCHTVSCTAMNDPYVTYTFEHALITAYEHSAMPLFGNTAEEKIEFVYTRATEQVGSNSVTI